MKYRCFDLFLCSLLIVPFGICILLISILVLLIDWHAPFYISKRVGKNEKPFLLFKIRTMQRRAPEVRTSSQMAIYVTPLGSFLRKFSLDELPQILNVFLGEMSWVGPRPCLKNEFELVNGRRVGVLTLPD